MFRYAYQRICALYDSKFFLSSYILKHKHMQVQILIHTNDEDHSKAVLERLVEANLSSKLNNYLNKIDKPDAEGIIEVTVDKNKKGLFDGKIQSTLDGKSFRFEREDYKNMDDLVNHLFDHFKEALSDM